MGSWELLIQKQLVRAIKADDLKAFMALAKGDYDQLIAPAELEYPEPPLTLAVEYNASKIFQFLVHQGVDRNRKGTDNWTPLLEAVFRKRVSMIETLILNGADVELVGGKASTWPLLEAILTDDIQIVELVANHSNSTYREWAADQLSSLRLKNRLRILEILKQDPA